MPTAPNVVLIGFMAAGKTTVGGALARALGYEYVDTDDLIRASAGCSIPEVFSARGEAAFRELEREAVEAAAARSGLVISCGGGAARDPHNVEALRRTGRVVWLRIGAPTATDRILADGAGRPMIDDHVPARSRPQVLLRVAELIGERNEYYEAAADQIVDVDRRSVEEIVSRILAQLEEHP